MMEGYTGCCRSVAWFVLVDGQSRMFFIIGRVYVPSAVVFSILTFWFWTWFDISEHMNSCKQR